MQGRRSKGFTLIEVIIVVILLGILITATPEWPGVKIQVESMAKRLVSDIRYTQALALSQNERYVITFNASNYAITELDGTPVPNPYTNDNAYALPSGMSLSSTVPYITFGDKGIPYIDTAVPGTPLATTAVITLSQAGETAIVNIGQNTGRVMIP